MVLRWQMEGSEGATVPGPPLGPGASHGDYSRDERERPKRRIGSTASPVFLFFGSTAITWFGAGGSKSRYSRLESSTPSSETLRESNQSRIANLESLDPLMRIRHSRLMRRMEMTKEHIVMKN